MRLFRDLWNLQRRKRAQAGGSGAGGLSARGNFSVGYLNVPTAGDAVGLGAEGAILEGHTAMTKAIKLFEWNYYDIIDNVYFFLDNFSMEMQMWRCVKSNAMYCFYGNTI